MNLKFKMSKKLTAVFEIISETQGIFSDECSPRSLKTLRLIESEDGFDALVDMAKDLAIELASSTRFKPVICLIKGKHMDVQELEASVEDEDDSDNPFLK